ncbi:MAG: polysaccharide biosynthesis tyrosine autokinase [Bacteroidota bacterium]|nr:polysaccharide biosynthesis tyrosine autokinase [Bacteroidota bacterium]
MRKDDNGIFGEENHSISIRDILISYLTKWPLFLASIIICVGCGMLYIKYTVPKYMAGSTFLIKDAGGQGGDDLVQSALAGKKTANINNELLLLSSDNLMQRTVAKNDFNIFYIKKGRILDLEIYKDAPFTLNTRDLSDSNTTYEIRIKQIDMQGGSFLYGKEKEGKLQSFRWNEPFRYNNQIFVLSPKGFIKPGDGNYIVRWVPVAVAAAGLSANFTAKASDTKANAIQLSIKTENFKKAADVLNAVFNEFNLTDIEDRNKLSQSTVQFIDDRLVKITSELKGVEGNLESYQGSNQLVDIKSQSAQSMNNSNNVTKTIQEIAVQQGVVSMISEYFENPVNGGKTVPSSLGLNDPTLALLIGQYNELQLKKDREAPLVAPNSTVMQDLNTQLANLKSSILESLNNLSRNLKLQERNFQQQNNQYQSMLSSVPHNERVMQEIKRKQSITEGLYLYLLQKREESAISSTTSSIAHYKQIDPAKAFGPVEPNANNIIAYTTLLGLFLPIGLIAVKNLLNDKISSKDDVLKRTSLPLLGQVSHMSKRKSQQIAVLERNMISEQFRAIRTNLSFLLKEKSKKTILITSSVSGEGKSFISLNLAAVIAMPGKKVALLEFDIRQPVISANLNLDNTKGITNYLAGDITNISQIKQVLTQIPSLHIYPSGPVPENPGDILLTKNLSGLFAALEAEYDYIIVDTPPAGLVSDPFIIGEFSEIVLYVLRHEKTAKKQIDWISEMVSNKSLKNVALILNDITKSDNYGYGYGSDYGYGYSSKKKKFSFIS